MKKNKTIIILAIVLIAIAVLLIWNNRYLTTLRGESADFQVWDTASITKVYLADRMDHETLLERTDQGWTLNGIYKAHPKKINQLFYTLYKVRVRMPVSVASHDNIITQMASRSTKVELYQVVPRINLFNVIKLFPHETRSKVFYVGESTMDNSGTFMLREGADQAYIVYIPGFRGYISTRFTADPDDWRDHTIFHETLANIQSVTIEFGDNPMRSFRIDNTGRHQYQLPPRRQPDAAHRYPQGHQPSVIVQRRPLRSPHQQHHPAATDGLHPQLTVPASHHPCQQGQRHRLHEDL